MKYPIHTLESAPDGSKEALNQLKASVGMIPNLAAAMAESPVLIQAFEAGRRFFQKGTISVGQRELLSLTNAVENGCSYCVAIHSTFALKVGVSSSEVEAIRGEKAPTDPQNRALWHFSRTLIQKRGNASADDLATFFAAGYTREQALEVVVGLANSVLANYSRHITHAPLDDMLQPMAWQAPSPS